MRVPATVSTVGIDGKCALATAISRCRLSVVSGQL
jgi:hypothetical protein